MFEEDPTLVHKSKLTVAKMMSKWFAMKKAVQGYIDSQNQRGAASEEPPSFCAEMNECLTTSQKNTVKGCQYGIQSTTSGPIKRFGFGYEEESTSTGESAKKSDGSTVRTSISTRIQFRVFPPENTECVKMFFLGVRFEEYASVIYIMGPTKFQLDVTCHL